MISFKLEVRYRDLDTLGHVNNAVYLTYFEQARVRMLMDYYSSVDNYDFVVAHASVDFLKPIYLEEITVVAYVSRIGNTSFTIDYEIYNSKNEICARGRTVQVVIDRKTLRKRNIPESLRKHLQSYAKKEEV